MGHCENEPLAQSARALLTFFGIIIPFIFKLLISALIILTGLCL